MRLDQFIAGVQIISKYYDNPRGYHIGADHDEFFMYPPDKDVSVEDRETLEELDWIENDGGWKANV